MHWILDIHDITPIINQHRSLLSRLLPRVRCIKNARHLLQRFPHEDIKFVAGRLNCSADDYNQTSYEYTDSSTVTVCQEAAKWEGSNLTKVVDDKDDSGG